MGYMQTEPVISQRLHTFSHPPHLTSRQVFKFPSIVLSTHRSLTSTSFHPSFSQSSSSSLWAVSYRDEANGP